MVVAKVLWRNSPPNYKNAAGMGTCVLLQHKVSNHVSTITQQYTLRLPMNNSQHMIS
jgi:hypothetical protein